MAMASASQRRAPKTTNLVAETVVVGGIAAAIAEMAMKRRQRFQAVSGDLIWEARRVRSSQAPTANQRSGTKISMESTEVHAGSAGRSWSIWSRADERSMPARTAGISRMAANLSGQGQIKERSVGS